MEPASRRVEPFCGLSTLQYVVIRSKISMVATRNNQQTEKPLPLSDYQSLAELRYQLRRFVHFSEQAVRRAGLEPRQHQLMLALKALPKEVRPRIGELAERLLIRHHSAVELVNRLATGGYVRRARGETDRREVLLSLTQKGEKVLRELSLHHRAELRTHGPALVATLKRAIQTASAG
jgi:DNA-binding MarR family transcriptional regulator